MPCAASSARNSSIGLVEWPTVKSVPAGTAVRSVIRHPYPPGREPDPGPGVGCPHTLGASPPSRRNARGRCMHRIRLFPRRPARARPASGRVGPGPEVHPRRFDSRIGDAGARLVGSAALRPRRAREPFRFDPGRVEHGAVPRDRSGARAPARSDGAPGRRQRRAGRLQARGPTRRRRVLRAARRSADGGERPERHGPLARPSARRGESALGRRARLDEGSAGKAVDRHRRSGTRRERLLAQQGPPGGRARQHAHPRDRRGPAGRGVERQAGRQSDERGRHHHVRLARAQPDQQLRRDAERGQLRPLRRALRRRGRPARPRLLGARRAISIRRAGSSRR
jgi:hypothetical protein